MANDNSWQEKSFSIPAGASPWLAASRFGSAPVHSCTIINDHGISLGELTIHDLLSALAKPDSCPASMGELVAQSGQPTTRAWRCAGLKGGTDLEAVLGSAPSGLMVVDAQDRISLVNPMAMEMLGLDQEEALGMPASFYIKDNAVLEAVLQKESFVGRPMRHQERSFLASCSEVQGGQGCRVLALHELEEVQNQWDEMRRLSDELTSLVDNSYDGIIIADTSRIIRVNASFGRITGLAPSQLVGKGIGELEATRHICLAAVQEVIRFSRYHRKSLTVRRSLKSGNEIFVTGSPVLDRHKQVTRVVINVRDITELKTLEEQIKRLPAFYQAASGQDSRRKEALKEIVVESPAMLRLLDLVIRVSQVDSTVLLLGESGVGKDVIARLIHRLSNRNEKKFISVNCGAIPETLLESEFFGYEKGAFTSASRSGKPGLFEQADQGILFLDEVSELPLNLQVKLLRVIQDRRCRRLGGVRNIDLDVRILAATNQDLREMVIKGQFREDLFYRLYVVPIEIPPLRKRREDILPMALSFLKHFNDKYSVTRTLGHELMQVLESHSWPGNVRELQNVIERMVVTADAEVLEARHLPSTIYQDPDQDWTGLLAGADLNLRRARDTLERRLIGRALAKGGNSRQAAQLLGVNHSTVVRKCQRLGLVISEAASASRESAAQTS